MDLKSYIITYDDVLDENLCKNAIDLFDRDVESVIRYDNEMCGFSSINITEECEVKKTGLWDALHQHLLLSVKTVGERYMKDVDCERYWPRQNSLEQIKMNKYQHKTEDRFDRHIDVGDYASARRFLGIHMYMNDVEGGATYFNDIDLEIPGKCGRILLYPSTWTFAHTYMPPKDDDKYAVTTYLHYT